jgi:RHS repeat-associated protein
VIDATGNQTSYAYDAVGNRITIMDRNSHVTRYEYDPLNRLSTITDASGNQTNYAYDGVGNLITFIDVNEHRTTYEYDPLNRRTRTTDAVGNSTLSLYDAVGNQIAVIDENDNRWNYTYDELGRLTIKECPLGYETKYKYDAEGNLLESIDAKNRTTYYQYDALNRQINMTNPVGYHTLYGYDGNGNLINVTDAKGHTTTYTYDHLNRVTIEINARGYSFMYTYDGVGNIIREQDQNGHKTSYQYDPLNRLIQLVDARNGTVNFTYDAEGNQLTKVNENHRTTSYTYDTLNRLVTLDNALGYETNYTYDAFGNLLGVIDANGHTTSYEYDSLNRLLTMTNPIDSTWSYSYDGVGNIIGRIDANSNFTSYTYDSLNRITTTLYPDGTSVTYIYDEVGNLLQRSHQGGINDITNYSYDPLDRLMVATTNYGGAFNKTVSYLYDQVGNIQTMTYPDGHPVFYGYDEVNQLTTITELGVGLTTYQYDGVGKIARMNYPNGFSTVYQYDALDRLAKLNTYDPGGWTFWNYTYTYDPIGNIVGIDEAFTAATTMYQYDALDQLTHVTSPSSDTVDYSYDGVGNRLLEMVNGLPTGYMYDDANRMLSKGSTTYTYDTVGNRLQKTSFEGTTTYSYNYENQVTSLTRQGGGTVQYQYSPSGAVLQKQTLGGKDGGAENRVEVPKECKWDPTSKGDSLCPRCYKGPPKPEEPEKPPLEKSDGGGTTTSTNVIGPTSTPVSTMFFSNPYNSYFYLTNHQSSITNVVNLFGYEMVSYEYDAFGVTTVAWGHPLEENPCNFMGSQYESDIGLYIDDGRFYEPESGRYLSPDMNALQEGTNAFSFEYNNPVDALQSSCNPSIVGAACSSCGGYSGRTIDFSCRRCGPHDEKKGHVECDARTGEPKTVGDSIPDLAERCQNHNNKGKGGKEGKDGKQGKDGKGSEGKADNKNNGANDKLEECGIVGVICDHEKIHEKDMKELCKKTQQCGKREARQRGMKLSDLDDQTLNKYCRDPMSNKWLADCGSWTECNAWKDSLKQFQQLAKDWDCCCDQQPYGSPSGGKNDECCKLICENLKNAENQAKDFCKDAEGKKNGEKCAKAEGIDPGGKK